MHAAPELRAIVWGFQQHSYGFEGKLSVAQSKGATAIITQHDMLASLCYCREMPYAQMMCMTG